MFAYCLNNPVNYKDYSGCYSICVVTGKDTEVVGEDSEATNYATTITYYWMDTQNPTNVSESQTTTFYYHIKNDGIVVYDNAQESSVHLLSFQLSASLAIEMLSESQKKLPGALAGRTIRGMAVELQAHFLARMAGLKLANTNTTEMGANIEGSVGYDYNADWFERPWRHISEGWNALFK